MDLSGRRDHPGSCQRRIGQAGAAGVIKLSPKARESHSVHDAIPSIPANAIAPFLSHPLVIEEGALKDAPTLTRCGAKAANFPRRNLIISGMCAGCLVVEDSLWLEHGRYVFTIHGSITCAAKQGLPRAAQAGNQAGRGRAGYPRKIGRPACCTRT